MEEMGQSAMFLNVTNHLHQHAHHLVREAMMAAMEEMGQSAMFLNVRNHLHQHAHHLVRETMMAAMEEMGQNAMFLNVESLQQHRNQPLKSQDMFINPPPTHVVSL